MFSKELRDYAVLRRQMVQFQLADRGIKDARVLGAFSVVPREKFVSAEYVDEAYSDHPLPIGLGQTISQPYMVALMTECLRLESEERVLEIGTGSGYQTAILAKLAGVVYTIERHEALAASAAKLLEDLEFANVHFRVGDGSLGWPEEAPFDRIIVTAAAPDVPASLVRQLVEDGILVIPVGPVGMQQLMVLRKRAGKMEGENVCDCVFVKLIGKEGYADSS